MIPKLTPSIVDRLVEPIIFLGSKGELRDFNSAARPLLRQVVTTLGPLRKQITLSAFKKTRLPQALGGQSSLDLGGRRLNGYLCECGDGFAVIYLAELEGAVEMLNGAYGASSIDAGRGFYALFNSKLRQEIGDLCETIQSLEVPLEGTIAELKVPLRRLGGLLGVLELLSSMLQSRVELSSERLSVSVLLNSVLANSPGVHVDAISLSLSDSFDRQGLVYGRASWLCTALQGLVDVMLEGVPPDGRVELRLRQHGNFLVLTGGYGLSVPGVLVKGAHVHRSKGELDDRVVAGGGCDQLAERGGMLDPEGVVVPRLDAGIRLSVANLIAEFHGGFLRLRRSNGAVRDETDCVEGFTLELPTGSPPERECSVAARARCIYPAQARSLAQDLARMLPKSVPESVLSSDEVSLLSQLMRGLECK